MITISDYFTRIENVGAGISISVSDAHSFGTDSFLLSYFAAVHKHDIACDLCSGCGIVPLLWYRGKNAPKSCYAVEIQEAAYFQTKKSVEISGIEDRFFPILADLRNIKGILPLASFDIVTCNPPYKAENTGILSTTESDKIARHETMCTLQDICESAAKLLRFGGRLCLCQRPERLVDVLSIMRQNKIEPKRLRFVQKNVSSAPWLILVEGKLGAKPYLQVDPPLVMTENLEPSAEIKKIYNLYGYTK